MRGGWGAGGRGGYLTGGVRLSGKEGVSVT